MRKLKIAAYFSVLIGIFTSLYGVKTDSQSIWIAGIIVSIISFIIVFWGEEF